MKVEPGQNHDAFSRLVDVAVNAPSLPVPKEEPRNRVNLPRGNYIYISLFVWLTLLDF